MTLLSIDPGRSYKGEKTIGWCLFTDAGFELGRGSLSFEEMLRAFSPDPIYGQLLFWTEELGTYAVDQVVIEDFVNNSQSKGGQRNGTSECIGAVEAVCHYSLRPFTRRPPSKLGPAKMHAPEGSFADLQHLRHEDSAFLHGHEYLIETGVLTVPGLADTL